MEIPNPTKEENPFANAQVAQEWIRSVEGEKDMSRDNAIYPLLQKWALVFKETSTIVEIGSGQGICSEKLNSKANYIGIEPSSFLVDRAKEKYSASNREFVIGNAYELPVSSLAADGIFSVNVWFHLENLQKASQELARALKAGASFLIVNANPDAYDIWESFYFSPERDGKRLSGKVGVPINPMSRNIFYEHSPYRSSHVVPDGQLVS